METVEPPGLDGVIVTAYDDDGRVLATLRVLVVEAGAFGQTVTGVWSAAVVGPNPRPGWTSAWYHFAQAARPRSLTVAPYGDEVRVHLATGDMGDDFVYLVLSDGNRSGAWVHWTDGGSVKGRWESERPLIDGVTVFPGSVSPR